MKINIRETLYSTILARKHRLSGNFRLLPTIAVACLATLLLYCGKDNFTIHGPDNIVYSNKEADGNVTGYIFDRETQAPLEGVKILVIAKGQVHRTTSEEDGGFILDMSKTLRGEGYSVHFQKQGYQNASRAAVFKLANHQTSVEDVYMRHE